MREHPNHSTTQTSGTFSTTNDDWRSAQKSLAEALAANRELQAQVLSELATIAQQKRDNRLEAERCIEQSCAVVLGGETTTTTTTESESSTIAPPLTAAAAAAGSKEGCEDNDSNGKKATKKSKRKKKVRGDIDYVPTSDDINELLAGDANRIGDKDNHEQTEGDKKRVAKVDDKKESTQKWSLHVRKKFRYDPHRKWTPDYFVDPTGSRPRENEDAIQRRKLMMKPKTTTKQSLSMPGEEQEAGEMVSDTFFYHTSPPFTPKEKALLDKWLFKSSKSNDNNSNRTDNGDDDDDDSGVFYESIAQKLRQEHHENKEARKKDNLLLPTSVPRTAEDMRLYHRHCLASQYKFSKEESLAILECVEEIAATESTPETVDQEVDGEGSNPMNEDDNQKSSTNGVPNQTTVRPDWQKICNRVLEVHRRQKSNFDRGVGNNDPPITPYQCMIHYKTKLRPQPDGSFTPEEDELLLRYITAMGPQFLWNFPQISDLASRLFPHKTSRRIYERTHFSQWHPLSKDTIWTKEEEQKLVLAMKIYSDTGDNEIGGASKNGRSGASVRQEGLARNKQSSRISSEKAALRKAATHFHPYRQPSKVMKKWERSFSPRFSYKPFSEDDDARLLAAVRSSAAATPFSEIAKKHFPDRTSDQLNQRWNKIAPDRDIVKKFVPSMVRSGLKRGLLSAKSGVDAASTGDATSGERSANGSNVQNRNGALFDTSDFVVEVVANKGADDQNGEKN